MRKEVIVAIFVGGIIGILLAFGVWRANSVLDGRGKTSDADSAEENNEISRFSELTVSSHETLSVASIDEATVAGIATPNSYVVVAGSTKAEITKSDMNGAFSVDVGLEIGVNDILVAGFDSSGEERQVKLRVIYSEGLTEDIEQDVEARIEEASDPLIGYIGTVTDITEGSLQIKDDNGIIRQITLQGDTVYENIINSVNEISLTDIAIGDFIAAIGTSGANNNETLESRKVLVTEPLEEPALVAFLGEVIVLDNEEFKVQEDTRDWSLDAKGGVQVTGVDEAGEKVTIRLSTIEPGENVIVAGNLVDNEVKVLTIHLVD